MQEVVTQSSLFINRELSWLAFNGRGLKAAGDTRKTLLQQAVDTPTPLLERVKFLSIFSSNLDEFYMVRVAGLRRQVVSNVQVTPVDGMSPQEQLEAIDRLVREQLALQRRCLDDLLEQLSANGIRLVGVTDLTAREWGALDEYFESQVFPVLTPLAVDPG